MRRPDSALAWRKSSRAADPERGGPAWRKSVACVNEKCVELAWRTSSHSNVNECVELARPTEAIFVRDSKNPAGPMLTFARGYFDRFLASLAG